MKDEKQAKETAPLFMKSGAMVNVNGSEIKVSGDLGSILTNCLEDADQMFNNKGEGVKAKYAMEERLTLYNWWMALKGPDQGSEQAEEICRNQVYRRYQQKSG